MKEKLKLFLKDCFAIEGRMNRGRYFLYPIILILLIFLIFFIFVFIKFVFLVFFEKGISVIWDNILGILIILVLLYSNLLFNIKRWRDLGKSGWMTILLYIPILGFFVKLYLLFTKGDEGPNKYGPDRLQE